MQINRIIFSYILLLLALSTHAQTWPLPQLPDTSNYGKYISRTVSLLQSSTREKPNTVKILVYGQSISAQDWWLPVRESIKARYPSVNLIMENKAIGGFASQILCKTVEMDVSTFYPDLVLLHIYGSNQQYDSVLYTIRSRTAAEVAIQTDHDTGENEWSDKMSYEFLPQMAEKYKCDLINVRDPWRKYLKDHQLQPKDLLKDDVHLNKYGEFLMAELIKPLFAYKSKYQPDPFGLCTTLTKGEDFKVRKGKLKLPFKGNRVDVVYRNAGLPVKATVLIGNQPPSQFQGTYFMTRPYGVKGKDWPWTLPAMVQVKHRVPWIPEEWTCKFTGATAPYDDFSFEISGSVTGKDGAGKGSEDFISPSGRVVIAKGDAEDGGDWHLRRSYIVLKTNVNTGDVVKWRTYSISMDTLQTIDQLNDPKSHLKTLFQGVPNASHTMKLMPVANSQLPIEKIIIYRPYLNRK